MPLRVALALVLVLLNLVVAAIAGDVSAESLDTVLAGIAYCSFFALVFTASSTPYLRLTEGRPGSGSALRYLLVGVCIGVSAILHLSIVLHVSDRQAEAALYIIPYTLAGALWGWRSFFPIMTVLNFGFVYLRDFADVCPGDACVDKLGSILLLAGTLVPTVICGVVARRSIQAVRRGSAASVSGWSRQSL